MSRELDIAVARAMGFRVVRDAVNVRGVQIGTTGRKGHDLPRYSESAELIPKLLERISADQMYAYLLALYRLVCESKTDSIRMLHFNEVWLLMNATPEQHCRAFIASTQVP